MTEEGAQTGNQTTEVPSWRYRHDMDVWKTQLSWRAQLFNAHASFIANMSSIALNSIIFWKWNGCRFHSGFLGLDVGQA